MAYELLKENEQDFTPERGAWVNEQHILTDDIDGRVEQIRRRGYTIIENAYTHEEVEYAKRSIDQIYDLQVKEAGGQENLKKSGDANIARQILCYDEFFLAKATNEIVIEVIRRLMGDYFILYQQNGNLNKPNISNTTSPWHRDLTFWHYTTSRPLAMSALHVIEEFTPDNGAVSMLPGSQKEEEFPSFDYVEENEQLLIATAGSICLFDSMMFHRSGFNRSDKIRYSINHMYTMPLMTQQISLPRMLDGKWSDDPFLRGFLGYNCMQQPSVNEWRKEKIENARKHLKEK